MDVRSTTVSKAVEVTKVVMQDEKLVTLILSEREAKILGCLIGSMSGPEVEGIITNRSLDFKRWIGTLEPREVVVFTGDLYDGLFNSI